MRQQIDGTDLRRAWKKPEFKPIVQAYLEGKNIELYRDAEWATRDCLTLDSSIRFYRVEQKYTGYQVDEHYYNVYRPDGSFLGQVSRGSSNAILKELNKEDSNELS